MIILEILTIILISNKYAGGPSMDQSVPSKTPASMTMEPSVGFAWRAHDIMSTAFD